MDTNKNCQICSYSKSTIFSLVHFELKIKYNLCENCKMSLQFKLKDELFELGKSLNIVKYDDNFGWKRIFYDITKKYNDSTDILNQIDLLINKTYEETCKEKKYKKPFNQCCIYNYDGIFHGYTTLKQMQHAIKFNKATKISDTEIKWNFPVIEKIENKYYFNYSRNKENKCLNCENENFLDTFSILPKNKICEYEGEGLNIHFYYAVCSKCKDYCTFVKEKCNSLYFSENGKNICEHINELIEHKKKEELDNVIKVYNENYKTQLSKSIVTH